MTASVWRTEEQTDDLKLVVRAADGDHVAFDHLHARYVRLVTSVVRAEIRRGASATDGDDVVQDVFLLAWQRIGDLRDHNRFKPWLLQIARRAVVDHARKVARRPVLDHDDDLALGVATDVEPGPAELAELADLAGHLRGALDGLSRRDATAITLAAQFGFGPTEIGDALGISANNAKVVLHRARARLRAALD